MKASIECGTPDENTDAWLFGAVRMFENAEEVVVVFVGFVSIYMYIRTVSI